MKSPILLRADDGLSWWSDADSLAAYVESPDIEEGIYTAWDADGQVLILAPAAPVVRKSFSGLRSVSVSPGVISETGCYEPDVLHAVIASHIKDVWSYIEEVPADLCGIVQVLCSLQPAHR